MEINFDKIKMKKPETHPGWLYKSPNYLSPARMSSIGFQYQLAAESGSKHFLEIGFGGGVLGFLFEAYGLKLVTMDINPRLNPTIVGSLPIIPLGSNSVETILCFQTLEHIPLDDLIPSLQQMRRVASKSIIISLPDRTPIPKGKFEKTRDLYYRLRGISSPPKKLQLDPMHYWEIGMEGITFQTIGRYIANSHLEIVKHFRNRYNPFHHFFVLV